MEGNVRMISFPIHCEYMTLFKYMRTVFGWSRHCKRALARHIFKYSLEVADISAVFIGASNGSFSAIWGSKQNLNQGNEGTLSTIGTSSGK